MTDQQPNTILELSRQFRRAIDKNDAAALRRLVDAYTRIYAKLQDKINLLTDVIEMENPTRAQLARMERYKSLIAQVEAEMTNYQTILANEVEAIGRDAITFASRDTARMMKAIGSEYGVDVAFQRLPTEAIKSLLGFLAEDGPLFERIGTYAGEAAQTVANTILEAVAMGKGPREVARLIRKDLGENLTAALRTTRTVQLWSYREATRANYLNNSDIIEGWYWYAALENDPCMACIAEHGTFHTMDETLDDHYNGRCAMLPAIRGLGNPVEQSGEEWFNTLDEGKQKELMGQGKYEAWKEGQFEFNQMIGKHTDDVYGQMTTETALKDLIGGGEIPKEMIQEITSGQVPVFTTTKEAEDWAINNKIARQQVDYYGVTPDAANIINQKIYEQYGNNSPIENIITGAISERGGIMMEVTRDGNFIVYNIASDPSAVKRMIAENESAFIQRFGAGRAFLARNYDELVIHELGHTVDFQYSNTQNLKHFWYAEQIGAAKSKSFADLSMGYLSKEAIEAASKISDYATTNIWEYFAESWLAAKTGREELVPDNVMEILRRAGL